MLQRPAAQSKASQQHSSIVIPACRLVHLLPTWHDSPGMGRENMTAKAPGSQGGNRERRMPRVASWVPRGEACMAFSRRVRSIIAS